jgi:hypothetical protein
MQATWDALFEEDDLPALFKNVEHARRLGKERFGNTVVEMAEEAIESDEMSGLLLALIVGNLAFEAQPACEMQLREGLVLEIRVKESE